MSNKIYIGYSIQDFEIELDSRGVDTSYARCEVSGDHVYWGGEISISEYYVDDLEVNLDDHYGEVLNYMRTRIRDNDDVDWNHELRIKHNLDVITVEQLLGGVVHKCLQAAVPEEAFKAALWQIAKAFSEYETRRHVERTEVQMKVSDDG